MLYLLISAAIVGLILVPQWWVKRVFDLHRQPSEDFPGEGAELARHLLSLLELQAITVQSTPLGDHYDPKGQSLNLNPVHFRGKSLTAVVIVAHEIGHVIQQKENNPWFHLRYRLAEITIKLEKAGSVAMLLTPFVTLLFRMPAPGILLFALGFSSMFCSILVHLITLPVEFDASFNKALPILLKGEYIKKEEEGAARRILKAAAFTYVASAMSNLLNVGRWIAMLRR